MVALIMNLLFIYYVLLQKLWGQDLLLLIFLPSEPGAEEGEEGSSIVGSLDSLKPLEILY